jgi:diguanylate cyclase (GGDEF)-like protein
MKFSSEFFQSLSRQNIIKYFVEDEVIMNWDILKKSILILCLGAAIHVVWIFWKLLVLSIPTLAQWVNVSLVKDQLAINIIFLLLHLVLIYPCIHLRKSVTAKRVLPFIVVATLVISLCRDGYLVGILSPATMIAYVSLLAVGCVLLPRIIVYSAFIPANIYIALCTYLTYVGTIADAPLFTNMVDKHRHLFWLLSMGFFITPILATCLLLFEILLSQWRHRERLIQRLSQLDPLTNVFNRRSINSSLENLDSSTPETYAIVLIDLDHFKQINDNFGHHKGDETLISVGEILKIHLRDTDIVGRFGGEEFILVLKNSSLEQTKTIAERCRHAISELKILSDEGEALKVSASFGIALSNAKTTPQQLITQADRALYQAKALGRNRVECFV